MTKYATLKKYQPYIDVIMEDLGLNDKNVFIEWEFKLWHSMGGDAILYTPISSTGIRWGKIRISNDARHIDTLQTIMHELKHIQQYLLDKLRPSYTKTVETKRGYTYKWFTIWMGEEYPFYNTSRNAELNAKYRNQPWEIEAYEYQKEVSRLFPDGKLPQKKLIGSVGKVKFYKL
jgi:hypothetical protein